MELEELAKYAQIEEGYSCHNEGECLGLLQGWRYNIEVLDGPNKEMKLEEDVIV